MAELKLKQLQKTYEDGPTVIHGINLDIRDGEFMVFVGPSGCGKTTTLRMIAGLEDISGGELIIGKQVVNDVPAAKRGVAMVFQSYALYPHMTVRENMGFGLRLAKQPKADVEAAVHRAADILQITHLLDRKPKALSGGQRQRVAIGRAIVRKPDVFLFDEPLSNLDASLRIQMRIELAKLHKELATTMVYVTHDQVEAMTLGDRIAVFNGGRIEQVGTPLALYEKPANLFVAGFLGSPRMNFLPSKVAGHGLQLADKAELDIQLPLPDGTPVTIGVRPEHIGLGYEGLAAVVDIVEHLGDTQIAYVRVKDIKDPLAVKLASNHTPPANGSTVRIAITPETCHVFGEDGKVMMPVRREETVLA
ncbi:ABC transporter ATP-binding protein [Chitinimonas sp. BJB300]|uniref:ABC transporter ATP-binding protein n=1 Tax=Chitinimonas sp. BJB300 TaxID=1559339 RepID=UPI000C0F17F8|nr:sn-glycerol-3-phosphate ABC transporter ATP-binding protein UgpC [Chitinimonas sp. BJB300]PHV12250.1 sugar ABC transporter ATP-binding protein [Chitinimonas sp. BJB300]TSJ84762.1 sn-glycerol-3-phosphate ABC transporter ATP-binding protein UgpC [Chitinimonas sp. BJB300]